MESLYKISKKDIYTNYGSRLYTKYKPYKLLKSVYPEYEWLFWKFVCSPMNSWDNKENQLQYIDWLGEHLGYTTKEDWYKITTNDFHTNYGSTLISNYYNSSPILLLKSMYPECEWFFWKFVCSPRNSWDSKENQLKYITWLGETSWIQNKRRLVQNYSKRFSYKLWLWIIN